MKRTLGNQGPFFPIHRKKGNNEMMIDRDIVKFCAIECRLQQSGELSVHWMVDAWIYAQSQYEYHKLPNLGHVLDLGKLVEPNNNGQGFRTVGVRVGSDIKMDWQLVPRAMVNLMEGQEALAPEGFFLEYEEIHPWRDGNGRTGVILYNWILGSLDNPIWAPNFWNDPRRTVGYGA